MVQTIAIPIPSPLGIGRVGSFYPNSQPESAGRRATIARGVIALTARERQILGLVAEGFSNKLIGHQLYISERTVKNHLTNIMMKLQAMDRTHAVVTALRMGQLSL